MRFLVLLRHLVYARPEISFVVVTLGLGELLIQILAVLPSSWASFLPWIVRLLTVGGYLIGRALIRQACLREQLRVAATTTAVARRWRARAGASEVHHASTDGA